MGSLRRLKLPGAAATSNLSAPILMLTSPVSNTTPEFIVYGEFVAGGDLQFERQAAGGDWSTPTVAHHTITSGEIAGGIIDYSLSALDEGNYEFRAKYSDASGAYSGYSPTEYGTIDLSLILTYLGVVPVTDAGGTATKTYSGFSIGNAFATRRIYLAASLLDISGSNFVTAVKINGTSAGVTLYQSGTGGDNRWLATAIVPTGTTMDVEINYASGTVVYGQPACYSCDDTVVTDPAPHDTQHVHVTTSANNFSMNVATLAGGSTIVCAVLYGGSSVVFDALGGDDTFTIDKNVPFAPAFMHAGDNQLRTAAVTASWTTADGDTYGTAWSMR